MLTQFARTMVTDFPIEAILNRLVERIVEILPITAAGVTLIEPGAFPRCRRKCERSVPAGEQPLATAHGLVR